MGIGGQDGQKEERSEEGILIYRPKRRNEWLKYVLFFGPVTLAILATISWQVWVADWLLKRPLP